MNVPLPAFLKENESRLMQTSTADLLRTACLRSRTVLRAWKAAKHLEQQDQPVTSATMDNFSIGFDIAKHQHSQM